jgi:steroid delta-isomerase-like uncharacterized protein
MNTVEIAQNVFNAWNRHDAEAIGAAYAEGAVYIVPSVPEPLHGGAAVAEYAKVVWTIFPDFSLEVVRIDDLGGGRVASQWVAHGTNTGPFPDGTPATGRKATFPGATFTQFEGDKIRSEQGYYDRLGEHKQLGLIPS